MNGQACNTFKSAAENGHGTAILLCTNCFALQISLTYFNSSNLLAANLAIMSHVPSHPVASGPMPVHSPGTGVAPSVPNAANQMHPTGTAGQGVQGPAGAAGSGPTEVTP